MKDTMTIDKAIEIHRGLKDIAEKHNIMIGAFYNTKEHEQIAEWLEELKRLQADIADLQPTQMSGANGWIPIEDELPENNKYILLSFANFSVPEVGRYEEDEEGGAFYIGDDADTCLSQDMIVNAWQPLPSVYEE